MVVKLRFKELFAAFDRLVLRPDSSFGPSWCKRGLLLAKGTAGMAGALSLQVHAPC